MLKRLVLIAILALAQVGCGFEYGEGQWPYAVDEVSDRSRRQIERLRRELMKIEDLDIGDGPVAAWGRRMSADLEVRYTDGTLVYRGPIFVYVGTNDPVGIANHFYDTNYLYVGQDGITWGLNGMRVGGRRRITIHPSLVCAGSLNNPQTCPLTNLVSKQDSVRKQTLVVEVTLTEACIPVILRAIYFMGGYLIDREVGCRNSATPQLDPNAPVWRFYR